LGSGPIKYLAVRRSIDSLAAQGGTAVTDLFLLSAQMRRIELFIPVSHGIPRVDDRRVISGVVFVIRNGLRWRDATREYCPHKTVYNRFVRWNRLGVFNKIFAELTRKAAKPRQLMIDATHLKAHRTAANLLKKGAVPRRIGRTKGGLNSKLHAVYDGHG
jgi:transposase